jgi:hypothetical protein
MLFPSFLSSPSPLLSAIAMHYQETSQSSKWQLAREWLAQSHYEAAASDAVEAAADLVTSAAASRRIGLSIH